MSREQQDEAPKHPPLLRAGPNKLVRAPGALLDQLRQRAAQQRKQQPQRPQANTPLSSAAAGRAAAAARRPAGVGSPQQQPRGRSNTWTRTAAAHQTASTGTGSGQAGLLPPAPLARPATVVAPVPAFGTRQQQGQRQSNTWTRPGAVAAVQQQQQQQQQQPAAGQAAATVASKPRVPAAPPPAAKQAAPPAAATAPAVTRPAAAPLLKPQPPIKPVGKGGKSVTVLSNAADGGQQMLLVYKKGKQGKSLRRTAVKAAARGSLTWHNPACLGSTAVDDVAAGSRPASGQRAAAAAAAVGVTAAAAAAAPPPPPRPSNSSGTAAASTLHKRRSGKWHKYVSAAAKPLIADPAASKQASVTRASSPASGPSRKQQSPRTAAVAVARGGSKLLRLGGSLYKVVPGKSRFKSLRRQSISEPAAGAAAGGAPLPQPAAGQAAIQVQQLRQQAAASPLLGAAAPGTRRLGRFKLVLAAAAGACSRLSPGRKLPAAAAAKLAALKPRGGVNKVVGSESSTSKKQQQQQRAAAAAGAAAGQAAAGRSSRRSSSSGRSGGSAAGIVYCPIYCRTGKCERRGKGCPYKHDSTKRAVCPRWLHGTCPLGTACSLQHQRKPELMPICMHFLKGCCTAEPCPYVHVNLPAGAPICTRFLRGYCPAGTACPHKHYTLRMVRDEKRMEAAPGASAAGGRAAGHGSGKRKERRGATGRYFKAPSPGDSGGAAGAGQQQSKDGTQGQEEGGQEGEAGEPGPKRRRRSDVDAAEAAQQASDALKPAFLSADFVPL